jgi:hypothetical protein
MSEQQRDADPAREPLLSPVDRVSELLFGLFTALTFDTGLLMVGLGAVLVASIRAPGG